MRLGEEAPRVGVGCGSPTLVWAGSSSPFCLPLSPTFSLHPQIWDVGFQEARSPWA